MLRRMKGLRHGMQVILTAPGRHVLMTRVTTQLESQIFDLTRAIFFTMENRSFSLARKMARAFPGFLAVEK